jgi:hypothetical protein
MQVSDIISKLDQISEIVTKPIKKFINNVRDELFESVEHFVAPEVIPETGVSE